MKDKCTCIVASDVSSSASAAVKPLSTSNNVSSTDSVKQPISCPTGNWNLGFGGFKFGGLTSSTPVTSGHSTSDQPSLQAAAVADGHSSSQPSIIAQSVTAATSSSLQSSHSGQSQSTVTSPAGSAAASVNAASVCSVTSTCSSAVSASLASAVSDSSQSFTTGSFVSTTCSPLTSHTSSTFTQQPSSLFSFGQPAFVQNSGKPLGIPSTSALQFRPQLCTGLSDVQQLL